MALELTEAYQKICQILVDNESIVSREDLKTHLDGLMDFPYTNDDMCLAYDWACQAIKRIIVHNYGEEALAARVTYGIHKYWVMNSDEVYHDDFVNDFINESDISTWAHTSYNVYIEYLPEDLKKDNDDEALAKIILDYHHKRIVKPVWIIEASHNESN